MQARIEIGEPGMLSPCRGRAFEISMASSFATTESGLDFEIAEREGPARKCFDREDGAKIGRRLATLFAVPLRAYRKACPHRHER